MPFFPSVTIRNLQPEMMDQPDLEAIRHRQALRGLARINFWSQSASIFWRPLRELQRETGKTLRILDVASGGGDVLCRLARKAQRAAVPMEFCGCDKSSVAIEYARQEARCSRVNIDFFTADVLNRPLPSGFDVIICSLFLHHLTEEQATLLLKKMSDQAESMILINDLLRSRSGWLLAYVGTRFLSLSPVVHYDGPRSVEGAFNREEVRRLAERAGLMGATITKCWPQRFLLSWRKGVPAP